WRRIRRERAIRLARERDRVEEDARALRAFDAMRFLQDRLVLHHTPDQQALGRQARIESLLLAILEQKIFAAVWAGENLVAFLGRVLDRRQDQLLFDGGIDEGGRDPAELLLGPGAEVLGFAAADLVGHGAPDADALGA